MLLYIIPFQLIFPHFDVTIGEKFNLKVIELKLWLFLAKTV
jgi:hypothetical protein